MKNDVSNIPSQLHMSDPNLLQYEFDQIVIKFYHKIFLALQSSSTDSGGQFLAHTKCIFLYMPPTLVLKNYKFC